MARRTSKKLFRNIGVMLTSTIFDKAGDFVTSHMNISTSTLTKSVYVRRHIASQGNFTLSFPGTDEPSEFRDLGQVFPYEKESYAISGDCFTVTAGTDNSQYYCVIPLYAGDAVTQNDVALTSGQEFTVDSGTVAFVYGKDFTVNDTAMTAVTSATVLACEFSPANIVAKDDTKIVQFRLVK